MDESYMFPKSLQNLKEFQFMALFSIYGWEGLIWLKLWYRILNKMCTSTMREECWLELSVKAGN